MKTFIALTAVVVLTLGNAIAAMPGAAAYAAGKSSQLVVMTAEQELPFDRYWSKN